MRRIDDSPFFAHHAAGAFAYGVMQSATGDGARYAWTVLAPLGIVARPAPPPVTTGPEKYIADRQAPRATADRLTAEALGLFAEMLTACGMQAERARWDARVDGKWGSLLERCAAAYHGNTFGDDRLDMGIHDYARALGRRDFISASVKFSTLFNKPIFGEFLPWSRIVSVGEFVGATVPVLGERAWAEVERLLNLAKGTS